MDLTNVHRLLRDAKLFESCLGQIDGAGNVATYLAQLVEAKTPVQSAPEPAEADTTEGSATGVENAKADDDAS